VKLWRLLFLFLPLVTSAQPVDSNYLKTLYDHCLDFDESKTDSLLYYGNFITENSLLINYPAGEILGLRLKGMYEEYKYHYENAITHYLQTLQLSRKYQLLLYELAAINDLAYVYINTKRFTRAKDLYLQSIELAIHKNSAGSLLDAYNNTGGAYNSLQQPDSALIYLNKALDLGKNGISEAAMSSVYNNLGNVYFFKKDYDSCLVYFRKNRAMHQAPGDISLLWYDCLNLADVFIEKRMFDSAHLHLQQCISISQQLGSRSKQADTYALLAKYYEKKADYKNAYSFQKKWYELDTSLVNRETNATLAALEETFHAKERQKDNQLLQSRIEKISLRNKYVSMLALAGFITALVVAFYLVQKRLAHKKLEEKNDLIVRQNEKLTELNFEKNSLISVVSHDLGTPLVTIKTWNEVLRSDSTQLTPAQQKASDHIHQSVAKGEMLIRNILDIEKADINRQLLRLERIDAGALLQGVVDNCSAAAAKKHIGLQTSIPPGGCTIISDKQLFCRIAENLLSNAIKYSPFHTTVWIALVPAPQTLTLTIKDEGPGISPEEIPRLFSKYTRLSAQPTNGETSTGLGLAITKRLVEELNGTIYCESQPGKGALFTVQLKN
jgi:signal transduction histidine kinase